MAEEKFRIIQATDCSWRTNYGNDCRRRTEFYDIHMGVLYKECSLIDETCESNLNIQFVNNLSGWID